MSIYLYSYRINSDLYWRQNYVKRNETFLLKYGGKGLAIS